MNKRAMSVLLCTLMISAACVYAVHQGPKDTGGQVVPESAGYELLAGDYRIVEDGQGAQRIEMLDSGYGAMSSPGDPALPERIVELPVPSTVVWSSLRLDVDAAPPKVLSGTYRIAPTPPRFAACSQASAQADWGDGKSISDGRNMNTYGKDADYPAASVELIPYTERKEPSGMGFEDAKFARIVYRPFLYNPVRGELTLIESVGLRLSYDVQEPTVQTAMSTYDYVIITTNDIVANSERLGNFVHLKELEGHSVKVVTETDYDGLTGQPPDGRAERIRQWLIDNQAAMDIDYVLLIGSPNPDDPLDPDDYVGDVPMKMMMPTYHRWFDRNSPTDYFFADLTGNWDLDGDELFGETVPSTNPKSPDPSIGEDTFSAEWKGQVMVDFAEDYEFFTFSDEGIELYIDGVKVIDHWTAHTLKNHGSGPLPMTVGKHDIWLRFWEGTGDAALRLHWETTDSGNVPADTIVPSDHLYDLSDVAGGLDATYYDNEDFTGASISRKDPEIDFLWLTGDEGIGGMDSGADVFVGRIPVYDDDYAQLDEILLKTIKYETDPGDIGWRESILLPMRPLWSDTPAYSLGELIKDGIASPAGFSYFRIYQEDYGVSPEMTPCEPDIVKDEWKNGYGMVDWATHGSEDSASHVFSSGLAGELDDTKPSLTFQASCQNAHPEVADNLAYSLLKHGAVGTIGATRNSWDFHSGYWSLNPNSAANHNLAYYYADKVILGGMTTGVSLYLTKGAVPAVDKNLDDFNLYGDPDLYLLSVAPNLPPIAAAGGPYVVDEGSTHVLDASFSFDPEGEPLEYRWDIGDDGTWESSWSADPIFSIALGDDYVGDVRVEVRDLLGLNDTAVAQVTVLNVDPTITDYEAYILVDFTLRVAGEKWHDVRMYVHEDGVDIGYAAVVRYPGSPDDQSVTLVDVKCDVSKVIEVYVLYTPDDDPVNGQPNGASPAWVNMSFDDGGYNVTHHTFNVRHPDTWEWTVGVNHYLVGHEITFEAEVTDPGSDDLTFKWEWDDGTPDHYMDYWNDGVGPDPYPSPDGTFPFAAADTAEHAFAAAGTYDVKLTVIDDDGGSAEIMIVIVLI